MLELRAGGGFRKAVKQFYFGNRLIVVSAVLSIAGVITGTTSAMALLQKVAPAGGAVLAAAILLAATISFFQTRHLPLAAMTALAPVPGLLWAAPVSGGSEFGAVPVLAYGFSLAFATLIARRKVGRVLGEAVQAHAWRPAAVAVAMMALFAVLWLRHTPLADAGLQAVADSAFSVLSTVVLLPLALTWLHFDESFVVRANRKREQRARLFEWVAQITIPRWAFSFTGITIIFLALGWYGADPLIRKDIFLRAGAVMVVAIGAGAVAGGWRQGLSVTLVVSTICLIMLWATVVDSAAPSAVVAVLQVTTLGIFFALYQAYQASALRDRNEPVMIAERRVLEQASGLSFAGLGAVAAALPMVPLWQGSVPSLIGTLVAVGAATALVPAVSTALEIFVPRRRSIEELYGSKKTPRPR